MADDGGESHIEPSPLGQEPLEQEPLEQEPLEQEPLEQEPLEQSPKQTVPQIVSPPSSKEEIKNFTGLKQKMGNPPLYYPDFARRAGMQGTISVLFYVTPQGLTDQIHLESSSGYSELDNFVFEAFVRL